MPGFKFSKHQSAPRGGRRHAPPMGSGLSCRPGPARSPEVGWLPDSGEASTCKAGIAVVDANRARRSAEARGPASADTSAPGRPRRILVADDDAILLRTTASVLSRSGYHVETASDGLSAWRTLEAQPFDLLITDHHMPHLTGLELARKVSATASPIPVILATGDPPARETQEHAWTTIVATLVKPIHPSALLHMVATALGHLPMEISGAGPNPLWHGGIPGQSKDGANSTAAG